MKYLSGSGVGILWQKCKDTFSLLTHIQTVDKGGTGATTVTQARTNLGLGEAATKAVDNLPTKNSLNLVTSSGVHEALGSTNMSGYTVNYSGDTSLFDGMHYSVGADVCYRYKITFSVAHPTFSNAPGLLEGYKLNDDQAYQRFSSFNGMWERKCPDGTWTAWAAITTATQLATKANIASPTFTGTPTVAANTSYTTNMVRNISLTTTDPGAGATSTLANGSVIVVYE